MTLRVVKQILRAALATATDEKLAEMLAFAQDGKMLYKSPCQCFLGSLGAEHVHVMGSVYCGRDHYRSAFMRFPNADSAYEQLAYAGMAMTTIEQDDMRQRRIVSMIKAQMRIRVFRAKTTATAEKVLV